MRWLSGWGFRSPTLRVWGGRGKPSAGQTRPLASRSLTTRSYSARASGLPARPRVISRRWPVVVQTRTMSCPFGRCSTCGGQFFLRPDGIVTPCVVTDPFHEHGPRRCPELVETGWHTAVLASASPTALKPVRPHRRPQLLQRVTQELLAAPVQAPPEPARRQLAPLARVLRDVARRPDRV